MVKTRIKYSYVVDGKITTVTMVISSDLFMTKKIIKRQAKKHFLQNVKWQYEVEKVEGEEEEVE